MRKKFDCTQAVPGNCVPHTEKVCIEGPDGSISPGTADYACGGADGTEVKVTLMVAGAPAPAGSSIVECPPKVMLAGPAPGVGPAPSPASCPPRAAQGVLTSWAALV